jgi:hypothetical protein
MNTKSLTELVLVSVPAESKELDIAGVGSEQSFADLDRRRLASTVRSEETETFAWCDGEVEAVDRVHVTVMFM